MLIPASLKGLKPGEISLVVLGRVIMGDIAVTLVDLAQRDLLRVEETDDGADWLLSPLHGVPARRAIAEYEAKLLEQLADRGQAVLLSSLAADLEQDLGKVRRALEHEAVAQLSVHLQAARTGGPHHLAAAGLRVAQLHTSTEGDRPHHVCRARWSATAIAFRCPSRGGMSLAEQGLGPRLRRQGRGRIAQ